MVCFRPVIMRFRLACTVVHQASVGYQVVLTAAMTCALCTLPQDKQMACMDACAAEYTAKVPKMKADCQQGLKQLGA